MELQPIKPYKPPQRRASGHDGGTANERMIMNATTTAAPTSKLYIRQNPHDALSIEIMHLTIYPDTIWMVHFWGDTSTAPPDLFSNDPRLEVWIAADRMSIGDYDATTLDELHSELTGDDPESFHGNGWTLMPPVPEH